MTRLTTGSSQGRGGGAEGPGWPMPASGTSQRGECGPCLPLVGASGREGGPCLCEVGP